MASYVLVEFDNDDQAQKLIDQLETKESMRAVGLFRKPTKFCECPPLFGSQQSSEITRGDRFGWWVHRACRRARKAPQSPRNLLEPIDRPARDRDIFLHLTPNYPIQVHHVSPRSS